MVVRTCVVCDLPFTPVDPHRDWVGDCCAAARGHVVSMQTDIKTAEALAVCPCSWSSRHPRTPEGLTAREEAVRAHWRDVVAKAAE